MRDNLTVTGLFASREPDASKRLMSAMDALNGRFGRNTVRAGGLIAKPAWSMRRGNLSPCYTTRIEDVLRVQA